MTNRQYDQLVAAWTHGRKREDENFEECMKYAKEVGEAICEHLGLPPPDLKADRASTALMLLRSFDEDPKVNYTLSGALQMREDGTYEMHFGIRLQQAPNVSPKLRLRLVLEVRVVDGVASVMLGGVRGLPMNDPAWARNLVARVVGEVEDDLRNGFDRFLRDGTTSKATQKIGFSIDSEDGSYASKMAAAIKTL